MPAQLFKKASTRSSSIRVGGTPPLEYLGRDNGRGRNCQAAVRRAGQFISGRWARTVVVVLLGWSAGSASAAHGPAVVATAATHPTFAPSYLDQQRQNERDTQDEINSYPITATLHRDAVARVFMDHGRLAVEIGGFEAPELSRINVSDSPGAWLVLAKDSRGPRAVRPRPMLLLNRYDFDQKDPNAIWATYLNVNPHSISLTGESLEMRIIFSEKPHDAMLSVNALNPDPKARLKHTTFQAHSLAELRNRHPVEYRQFLQPLLGKLTDISWMLPGTSDVYEVFNDIPADDASSREVKSLLPALDSTVPAERTAAMERIEEMGGAGNSRGDANRSVEPDAGATDGALGRGCPRAAREGGQRGGRPARSEFPARLPGSRCAGSQTRGGAGAGGGDWASRGV